MLSLINEEETIVRCFTCSAAGPLNELDECPKCGTRQCAMNGCSGRCGCAAIRSIEHPEIAKRYYGLLDEANGHMPDAIRMLVIESELSKIESECGW